MLLREPGENPIAALNMRVAVARASGASIHALYAKLSAFVISRKRILRIFSIKKNSFSF